jgi:hypothetical protein
MKKRNCAFVVLGRGLFEGLGWGSGVFEVDVVFHAHSVIFRTSSVSFGLPDVRLYHEPFSRQKLSICPESLLMILSVALETRNSHSPSFRQLNRPDFHDVICEKI